MTRALLVLAILGLLAVPAGAATNPRLRAFSSCKALAGYARAHAQGNGPSRKALDPTVSGPATPTPSATGEGGQGQGQPDAASGTNVQEPGIDEPDVVKTDGTTMFTAVDGSLRAIDMSTPTPTLLSSLPLEGGGAQILEHEGRLLVITRQFEVTPQTANGGAPRSAIVAAPGGTVLTEVDARDPANMHVVRTMRADGAFVDARQKDAVARVVLSAEPTVRPVGPVKMPAYRLAYGSRKGGHAHSLVACAGVLHPAAYDGTGLLTVLTIDLDRGLPPIDSDAVMTSGEVVYGSATSLYVATAAGPDATDVHKFDTSDPTRTDYRASGQLPGELLNQYLAVRARRPPARGDDQGRARQREPGDRARGAGRQARARWAASGASARAADLCRALHRHHRLRRDLPADRSPVHPGLGRPHGAQGCR